VSALRRLIALSLGLLAVPCFLTEAGAADSVNDCFSIVRTEKDTGIDFELSNGCDRSIACNMQWTVQCESAAGKVVKESQGRAGAMLGAGGKSKVFGSADACRANAGWTIDNVSFSCTPVR